MVEFRFKDSVEPKFSEVGDFHCGYAFIRDGKTNLYGYIDKTGKEAIPCRYEEVEDFSENLALVKTVSGFGYIDKAGNMIIEPTFLQARSFSCGLAVVQMFDRTWGYIDKNGRIIIGELPFEGLSCTENKVLFKRSDGESLCYDGKSIKSFHGSWVSSFSEGYAIAENDKEFLIVDENLNIRHTLSKAIVREIGPSQNGLFRLVSDFGKVGYLNHQFEMPIPFLYKFGRDFKDGKAYVEMTDEVFGYIDFNGTVMAFMKNLQYRSLGDYEGNLAVVKSFIGYGVLDKQGREVIPCSRRTLSKFSEDLAASFDGTTFKYIDKLGEARLELPSIYCSTMNYLDRSLSLEAETKEELYRLKVVALNNAKKELVRELEADIQVASSKEKKKI